MDSDCDMSAEALSSNYDVIDLKQEDNPMHATIKDILEIYLNRNNEEESFNPEAVL